MICRAWVLYWAKRNIMMIARPNGFLHIHCWCSSLSCLLPQTTTTFRPEFGISKMIKTKTTNLLQPEANLQTPANAALQLSTSHPPHTTNLLSKREMVDFKYGGKQEKLYREPWSGYLSNFENEWSACANARGLLVQLNATAKVFCKTKFKDYQAGSAKEVPNTTHGVLSSE